MLVRLYFTSASVYLHSFKFVCAMRGTPSVDGVVFSVMLLTTLHLLLKLGIVIILWSYLFLSFCGCFDYVQLVQDTHIAFPPLGSCVDSVSLLSPSLFACGTQGGLLALFTSSCKRPLSCVRVSQHAAAVAASGDTSEATHTLQALQKAPAPLRATAAAAAVSAVCAFPFTDALLVGLEEGTVQLWEASQAASKCRLRLMFILRPDSVEWMPRL